MTKNNSAKHNSDELVAHSVDEQALVWFTRLADTPVKAAVRLEFLNWCAQKPENKQAFDRIAAFWDSDVFVEALQRDEQRLNTRPLKIRRLASNLGIAAALLIGVWSVVQSGWLQRLQADDYTGVGQQRTMTLADGSDVTLDTDSAITVAYNNRSRQVTLLSGRAFFNVQPDAARPFIVNTGDEQIRVVGTRFTVDSDGDTPLIVQQGIVTYHPVRTDAKITVTAGEQLEKIEDHLDVVATDPRASAFAWLDGRLKFKDRPLARVVAEIDRYQPGVIVIAKPGLGDIRLTGNYKLNNPKQIIASLAQATGANVARVSAYLTVIY